MAPLSRRRRQAEIVPDTQFTLRARPLTTGIWHYNNEGDKRVLSHLSQPRVEAVRHNRKQAKQNDDENNQNLVDDDDDDDEKDDDDVDEMKTTLKENASATLFAAYRKQKPRQMTKCQSNSVADCCQAQAAFCYCCCCAPSSKSPCANPAAAAAVRQPASRMIRSTIRSAVRPPSGKCITTKTRSVHQNANSTTASTLSSKQIGQETMTKTTKRRVVQAPEVSDEMSQQGTRRRYSTANCKPRLESDSRNAAAAADDDDDDEISPLTSEDDENIVEKEKRTEPTNRWSRHSAGCTSPSLSSASSASLNSLSSLNSLELSGSSRPRALRPADVSETGKFCQLTSGAGSASVSVLSSGTRKRRPAPLPPKTAPARRSQSVSDMQQQQQQQQERTGRRDETSSNAAAGGELLSEQEVHAIEHFLRSHKSSVYVCGCMANLYFTKTHLADNGRTSRAASGEWKLNKTGVPVLIFDSGLAKNRQKKRLSISLTERGSGFVLWSDTIDHLSNYRAFSPSLHSIEGVRGAGSGQQQQQQQHQHQHADTCYSFHVMYLSSNHRIMVGLSFDNPLCARLFLDQIELVCSDPSNIALTGPKNNHLSALVGARTGSTRGSKLTPSLSGGGAMPSLGASRGLTGKLNLFNLKGASRATSTTTTSRVNQSITSAGWSTLRRAARLAGRGATGSQRANLRSDAKPGAERPLAASEQVRGLLEAFKPRPLAQLAAEGKVWTHKTSDGPTASGRKLGRAQLKKIPRKCDISAPCLFQHVTSVDQTNLDTLYSKSFVLERQLERTSSGAATSGLLIPLGAPAAEQQPEVISRTPCRPGEPGDQHVSKQVAGRQVRERTPNRSTDGQTAATCRAQEQVAVATTKSSSLFSSSSSSCYSSGSASSACSVAISCAPSRSPASSDSDRDRLSATESTAGQQLKLQAHHHHHHHQRVSAGPQIGLRVARPPVAPPKPPQREPAPASQSTFVKRQPPAASGGANINSILRELRSQVSSDLVDAKRRLMADIANRVGAGGSEPAPGPGGPRVDHRLSTAKTSISRL